MIERPSPAELRGSWALRDREISAEERRRWTIAIAAAAVPATQQQQSALIFRVGPEWLALPTSAFHEVAPTGAIHSLPHRDMGAVLGVANVRGELLTCVSINHLLHIPAGAEAGTATSRFLVAQHESHRFVLLVDEVDTVHQFEPEALVPVPATVETSAQHFSSGILRLNSRIISYLDAPLLMAHLERVFA